MIDTIIEIFLSLSLWVGDLFPGKKDKELS